MWSEFHNTDFLVVLGCVWPTEYFQIIFVSNTAPEFSNNKLTCVRNLRVYKSIASPPTQPWSHYLGAPRDTYAMCDVSEHRARLK